MQPLYRQVAADIQRQIETGALRPGQQLPSTRQLQEHYEVSEIVIRQAMIVLKAAGAVTSVPGKGVYVAIAEQ